MHQGFAKALGNLYPGVLKTEEKTWAIKEKKRRKVGKLYNMITQYCLIKEVFLIEFKKWAHTIALV